MAPFFILGLPRSRTAWLANFMTYNGFHCMHEGLNGCYNIEEYKTKLLTVHGDANTGLVMYNFRDYFPFARTVIIDSSITESVQYGLKVLNHDYTSEMLDMKTRLDDVRGLHIPIASINKELPTIWAYLTHDAPYDEKRAKLLKSLNIQVKQPYEYNMPAALTLNRSEHDKQ